MIIEQRIEHVIYMFESENHTIETVKMSQCILPVKILVPDHFT